MIAKLIVSHGALARELLAAAERIAGCSGELEALCLDWDDDVEQIRRQLRDKIEELDQGEGVLVLTDLFGATPCKAALALDDVGEVEVLSGVNLPMVVRLACCPAEQHDDLESLARWAKTKAVKGICIASELKKGTGDEQS